MTSKLLFFFAGCLLGAMLMWTFSNVRLNGPPEFSYPVTAKLYRMRIHQDQRSTYQDWVDWHAREESAINATMERERMYTGAVFRDTVPDPDVIYCLAINGGGGKAYQNSPLPADKKHDAYMKKILVKGSGSMFKTEFLMLPPFVENSIALHQQQER